MKLKQMEPQYINNIGNWKPDTQDECYLDNMPINIMKAMAGPSEIYKVHYNPGTVPKPPEELQTLPFSFIERCKISLKYLDASDTSLTACYLLDLMERGRTVLIQYITQLINIGSTRILFYHEVFKTELFLKYKEIVGTFFRKSLNPVSQSLKAILP